MAAAKAKKSLSKAEFLESIGEMSDDQFKDFAKERNRDIRDMLLWKDGEEHIARGAWRLMNDLIKKIVEIEELEAYISENPTPDAMEALAHLKMSLEDDFNDLESKVDSFCGVIMMEKTQQARFKAMAEMFIRKAKSCEGHIDGIRSRMATVLKALQVERIKGTFFKVAIGKPTYSIEINEMTEEDLEKIPDQFKKTKVSIDATAVKAALLGGEKLEWAVLIPDQGVRIY